MVNEASREVEFERCQCPLHVRPCPTTTLSGGPGPMKTCPS